jgi:hypothetical protein
MPREAAVSAKTSQPPPKVTMPKRHQRCKDRALAEHSAGRGTDAGCEAVS